MRFAWLSRWLNHKSPRTARRPGTRIRLEELEPRVLLNNDFYLVRGSGQQQTSLAFNWFSRDAAFNNELGVYTVTDDAGHVGNLLPTDTGYAAAALQSGQVLFSSGQGAGAAKSLSFTGGTLLGFYLIQNNNT